MTSNDSNASMPVDWDGLTDSLGGVLRRRLVTVLEGADEDIQKFMVAISADLTRSIREGNEELSDELRAQARGIMEMNRLRLVNAGWGLLDEVLGTVLGVGTAMLSNLIASAIQKVDPTTPS
tara:strand:+ start:4364 stop:4729 length:366 start_codon:yes stop_codon:yes gene_type:complete